MSLPATPSQTVGPFFAVALPWPDGPYVVPDGTPAAVRLSGRVLDGAGEPVADALVETWQADPNGRFAHPDDPRGAAAGGFRGFGRCPADTDGRFWVLTVKPGAVPDPGGGLQAPHLDLSIFHVDMSAANLVNPQAANAADPVLARLPEPARATLLAGPAADGYQLDIHLQGEHATVFFAV